MFWSNAAKQLSSAAFHASKTAAKYIEMKDFDVGKPVAIDAGKKVVEKTAKKLPHQNRKWLMLCFYQKKFLKSKRSYSKIC